MLSLRLKKGVTRPQTPLLSGMITSNSLNQQLEFLKNFKAIKSLICGKSLSCASRGNFMLDNICLNIARQDAKQGVSPTFTKTVYFEIR